MVGDLAGGQPGARSLNTCGGGKCLRARDRLLLASKVTTACCKQGCPAGEQWLQLNGAGVGGAALAVAVAGEAVAVQTRWQCSMMGRRRRVQRSAVGGAGRSRQGSRMRRAEHRRRTGRGRRRRRRRQRSASGRCHPPSAACPPQCCSAAASMPQAIWQQHGPLADTVAAQSGAATARRKTQSLVLLG